MTSTQQRAELQCRNWQVADDVRGAVDGWDSKHAILVKIANRGANG